MSIKKEYVRLVKQIQEEQGVTYKEAQGIIRKMREESESKKTEEIKESTEEGFISKIFKGVGKMKIEAQEESIKAELEKLRSKKEEIALKEQELIEESKRIESEKIKRLYTRGTIINEPISWIDDLETMQTSLGDNPQGWKHGTYLTFNPTKLSRDNPQQVSEPLHQSRAMILIPETWVDFSGKVRVTIEPVDPTLVEEEITDPLGWANKPTEEEERKDE